MCITAFPAKPSNTLIYAGETRKNDKIVHVLAYQNNIETNGGNAMVIPFPALATMGPENVLDTTDCKDFLNRIASQFDESLTKGSRSFSTTLRRSKVEIFDSGSYTVILANDFSKVTKKHLNKIPKEKQVEFSKEFINSFQELYPDWPVAMCFWNGKVKAEPLFWWYEPKDSSKLFLPTFDAHGDLPKKTDKYKLSANKLDHTLMVGSTVNKLSDKKRSYLDMAMNYLIHEQIGPMLPREIFGVKFKDKAVVNSDIWVDLHENLLEFSDRVPPGLE